MAVITYTEAINQAFKEEMRRNERVVMWGMDLISMNNEYGQTEGIYDEFGEDRIKDTPICEVAIGGMTMGAAHLGLRPIGVFESAGFCLSAFDGLFLNLGMQSTALPIVIYSNIRPAQTAALGISPEALFMHSPYLKVVMPSTPYDAKGLLKTAIRDDGPVLFFDHTKCFWMGHKDGAVVRSKEAVSQEVPDEEYLIPFGKADIKNEGTDITLVAYSFMVHAALAAAHNLEKEDISVEVVDLRTLVPLDVASITDSTRKTGRLLIVHEAMKRGGVAGEIIFRVSEHAPDLLASLKTPFRRLAARNLPLYPSPSLIPSADKIADTIREMVSS